MPSPFPGIDPYLENPDLWSEVHDRLIVAIAYTLGPALRPRYRVGIEKRTYLDDAVSVKIPDVSVIARKPSSSDGSMTATLPTANGVAIVTVLMPSEMRERYLEIREVESGQVITALEILSPTNKRLGRGRQAYEDKRSDILGSQTHLIEIDLLRAGEPMQILGNIPQTDYRILVSRYNERPQATLYSFNLRQTIPQFPLPLQQSDQEPWVHLQDLVREVYDQAGFDLAINDAKEVIPPLSEENQIWADTLLHT